MKAPEENPEFDLGLPLMDDAHRRQAELIRQIERATAEKASPASVQHLLLELVEETREHFATEQGLMRDTGYPDYAAHVAEHEALLERVSALLVSHSAGYSHLTRDLAQSLTPWLLKHIKSSDRDLSAYLQKVGWPLEARVTRAETRATEEVLLEQAGERGARDMATAYARRQLSDPQAQIRLARAFQVGFGACRDGAFVGECPHFATAEEADAWRAGWRSQAERGAD